MFILHNIYIHYGPNTETAHIHIIPCPLNKGEVEVSCKKYYWLVKEETIMALLMKIIFNVSVAATHTVGTTYNHFISAWTIEF